MVAQWSILRGRELWCAAAHIALMAHAPERIGRDRAAAT